MSISQTNFHSMANMYTMWQEVRVMHSNCRFNVHFCTSVNLLCCTQSAVYQIRLVSGNFWYHFNWKNVLTECFSHHHSEIYKDKIFSGSSAGSNIERRFTVTNLKSVNCWWSFDWMICLLEKSIHEQSMNHIIHVYSNLENQQQATVVFKAPPRKPFCPLLANAAMFQILQKKIRWLI